MAEVRIDAASGKTIPCMAVRDSDGAIWDDTAADFAAANTFTDAELKTAVDHADMRFASVANESSTHIGYDLTLPAGVAAVACTLYAYDGLFTAGDRYEWSVEYDPSIASILADTNELQSDDVPGLISTHDGKLDTAQADLDTITDTGVTVSNKTGFKLASDGLDSVSTTAPSGVASNFREMLVQTWRRFFRKATQTDSELKTYADNGTSVLTTQDLSDDNTTQTQGTSS